MMDVIRAITTSAPRHPLVDLAQCAWDESHKLLTYDERTWVPDDSSLRSKLVHEHHDSPFAGHNGKAATFEALTRRYWWPQMRSFLDRYIKNCDTCKRSKAPRQLSHGLLKPLEVPVKRWTSISIDFVTGLPTDTNGNNTILVVVDRLSKMAHFLPLHFGPDNEDVAASTKRVARLLRDRIVVLHGLPSSIVSDRDPRFTSRIARELASILNIQQNMSTAAHPETDGQAERVIQTLEQYLRAYVSYQQDDWIEWLALAEFAYNNTVSATTGLTPFMANYGYHPDLHLDKANTQKAPDFRDDVARLQRLDKHLRAEILYAQDVYKEQADRRRRPPPVIPIGSYVWLSSRHIRTTRPSRKLDYKRLGRFKVLERVGTHAYKLDLPSTMKIHPVFHVSLLEPCDSNPLPGQQQPTEPPALVVNGEEEWEVERILDSRWYYRKFQYLVQWIGYDHPTWEPAENVLHAPVAVREFHASYPAKPRPSR